MSETMGFLTGVPLTEQLLLHCFCGNKWFKHVPNRLEFLGGPQVQCPKCNGHNDARNFLGTLEDAAISAILPPPVAGLLDGFIHHAPPAEVVPPADVPTHYDGSADGSEVAPVTVAEEPTTAPTVEPAPAEATGADVDAADEVVNNG